MVARVFGSYAFLVVAVIAWAASGSLSGTLKDASGGVIAGAQVTLVDTAQNTRFKAATNTQGFYSFPVIAVGRYDLLIEANGFQTQKKLNVVVDADAALRLDVALELSRKSDTVT